MFHERTYHSWARQRSGETTGDGCLDFLNPMSHYTQDIIGSKARKPCSWRMLMSLNSGGGRCVMDIFL